MAPCRALQVATHCSPPIHPFINSIHSHDDKHRDRRQRERDGLDSSGGKGRCLSLALAGYLWMREGESAVGRGHNGFSATFECGVN